ncbi:MAG TPA: hypothetical protein VGF61_12160 [Candidatus Acidoferrum sp.]|jgi:hypothetical protein
MKRFIPALSLVVVSFCLPLSARAQMGMDMFKKPSFTKVFNPVVGKGAEYQTIKTDSKTTPHTMQMFIVGKESVDGKDGYWMEIVTTTDKGGNFIGKTLFTKDDFQFRRMVIQLPGQGAMEMPFNPAQGRNHSLQDTMNEWHSIGTESVAVPAGTFSCEHWKNDKNNSDVWTNDKVTPFGMVKEVSPNNTMVLTKVLTDMPDQITGPVQKFDPQMMMQQRQQQPKP